MSHAKLSPPIYGLLAEFDTPTELVHATEAAYAAGYRKMDAYSPFPIEEASEALGFHKTRVPLIVLLGGLLGGASGFALAVLDQRASRYPLNIGGKPYRLVAGIHCSDLRVDHPVCRTVRRGFGMFALNGLPMPYHPLFNVDRFSVVTRDKFFLCVEAADPSST